MSLVACHFVTARGDAGAGVEDCDVDFSNKDRWGKGHPGRHAICNLGGDDRLDGAGEKTGVEPPVGISKSFDGSHPHFTRS